MYDVLRYIHDHIKEPLTAEEAAKVFGYSKWYFCDRFKEFTNRTFGEYVRHYRIQLAAAALLSGGKVVEVATTYGYEGVSGFNKAFLRAYGCSPTEYRRQVQESQLYYEKRRIAMIPLSDRCRSLREEAVTRKEYMPLYGAQRNIFGALGQAASMEAGLTNTEVAAAVIVNTLERFTPVILPGECVVGFNFGEHIYHEEYLPTDDEVGRLALQSSGATAEEIRQVLALRQSRDEDLRHRTPAPPLANAHGRATTELPLPNPNAVTVELTEAERLSQQEWATLGRSVDCNHSVLAYDRVLKRGYTGLLEDVEAAEAKNGPRPLYAATKRLCTAACKMGEKYAAHAQALLESGDERYNPVDLQQIIAVCSRVPRHPAASFREAVQALWFAHILNTWEDFVGANSLGRLDQILYPYYKADVEAGVLTKEEAFELICCLWLKLYRDYDVQQVCLGGTNPDGTSAVNDLSYLMLDVTEQLGFIRCLSVRYGKNTEKAFIKRALEVVGHVQKGLPFFFNDDVMIPALEAKGIPHEDACGYALIGCVETVIPGRSNPHAVTGQTNLLKAMEYVLENGHSMRYPEYATGLATGELKKFSTYDRFYAAILAQIRYMLELNCAKVKKYRDASVYNNPKPYKSLLTEGCIESGRDFNDGGALYDYYQISLGGLPNLADSLAVVKKFVYEEKKYTLEELKAILEADFPDEAVRQEFLHKAPKYGNDVDAVDLIAADILDKTADMLEELSEKYGLSFHAQPFTFLWMIDFGHHAAASPDGRRAGEPIAYSCSAMQGRDFGGLTALLNSIAKLPAKKAPGTVSTIVEVDPKLFCDRNIDTLTEIFLAASQKGLCNVQFNITDADTLRDAQKHPEHYANLAVRVSGFSQKFNLLSPELQEHIIGRTKHQCL